MSDESAARYRRWYDYEHDAHAKVVQSLESVPVPGRSSADYRRALAIFAHTIAARRMWLGRLGVLAPLTGPLFPAEVDLAQVLELSGEVELAWSGWLARLDDTSLESWFEYQSLDAGRFRSRIDDVLAQLFGHSWYHRGQIAMLVRAAGGEPAITDLIYWCREPIPEAGSS